MELLLKISIIAVPLFSIVRGYSLSNTSNVHFFLYTKTNEDRILLTDSNMNLFDPTKCTKVIIHGFNVNSSSPWIINMARRFAQKDNCNSIAVDWGRYSETLYIKAAFNSKLVAQITAEGLLTLLSQNKTNNNITADVKNVHIIGHSVGAHLAGLTGHKMATKLSGTKVKRISGLDPAGPYFDAIFTTRSRRIQKHDADFVDIIHTDAFYGYNSDLGHVDFYPNGGRLQPQCEKGDKNLCSHSMSHEYFYKSIEAPDYFVGTQCMQWDLYLMGSCKNKRKAPMGIATPPDTRKRFYLRTKYKET
ncbi:pancreatic lipase-related protein 2 isoform X2 [Agrilus planipennis]|uniref:Pancreatic lipase-related protein 2 isoform X2 n=1 Tax=Agrilus planipennis TaxID=224129 RepID=A0A1W4WWC2_AGRPL|nr:pancreatic lipase-related protein 2 isoform X2 [Agrilus planipennis]